ncbi:MAG: hypothetical protein AAFN17_18430 [Pseudomonadota bacterium]
MRARRRHISEGYALVEVLAAMTIVVLIGTLAFLSFGNQDSRRLDAEVAEVALLLQSARMRALEAGRPVEIVISADQRVLDAGGRQIAFDRSVGIEPAEATILLRPSGNSNGLQLTLTRGDARKIVTLDWLTGQVAIQ